MLHTKADITYVQHDAQKHLHVESWVMSFTMIWDQFEETGTKIQGLRKLTELASSSSCTFVHWKHLVRLVSNCWTRISNTTSNASSVWERRLIKFECRLHLGLGKECLYTKWSQLTENIQLQLENRVLTKLANIICIHTFLIKMLKQVIPNMKVLCKFHFRCAKLHV